MFILRAHQGGQLACDPTATHTDAMGDGNTGDIPRAHANFLTFMNRPSRYPALCIYNFDYCRDV